MEELKKVNTLSLRKKNDSWYFNRQSVAGKRNSVIMESKKEL